MEKDLVQRCVLPKGERDCPVHRNLKLWPSDGAKAYQLALSTCTWAYTFNALYMKTSMLLTMSFVNSLARYTLLLSLFTLITYFQPVPDNSVGDYNDQCANALTTNLTFCISGVQSLSSNNFYSQHGLDKICTSHCRENSLFSVLLCSILFNKIGALFVKTY